MRKTLLAVSVVCFLLLSCRSAPVERLPAGAYAHTGPKVDNIAIFLQGSGEWSEKLALQLSRDLQARSIRAIDASPMKATAKDDAEVLQRIKDAGFSYILVGDLDAKRNVGGIIAIQSESEFDVTVRLQTIAGAHVWKTDIVIASTGIGRGNKLIRSASQRVVNGLKKDGVIER